MDGEGELRVSLQEDRTVEEEDDDAGAPVAAFSAHLVGAASYPNAIKWSEDNLIAVATSQLITILVRFPFSVFFSGIHSHYISSYN